MTRPDRVLLADAIALLNDMIDTAGDDIKGDNSSRRRSALVRKPILKRCKGLVWDYFIAEMKASTQENRRFSDGTEEVRKELEKLRKLVQEYGKMNRDYLLGESETEPAPCCSDTGKEVRWSLENLKAGQQKIRKGQDVIIPLLAAATRLKWLYTELPYAIETSETNALLDIISLGTAGLLCQQDRWPEVELESALEDISEKLKEKLRAYGMVDLPF